MNLEKEIFSYLVKYGNTKESDIINHCTCNFNLSQKAVKKAIDRLAVKNKIHRIVHDKLKPPQVYVSLNEPLPPELLNALIGVDVAEAAEGDARKILEEAAELAERRIKENSR